MVQLPLGIPIITTAPNQHFPEFTLQTVRTKFLARLTLVIALVFPAQSVQSADECGTLGFENVITCDGGLSPASDVKPYPNGISYQIDGLKLTIHNSATTINSGTNTGVSLRGTDTQDIGVDIAETVTINTMGNDADGVSIIHDGTGAISISSSANIFTTGDYSRGLNTYSSNPAANGNIEIAAIPGVISTTGIESHAIQATHTGNGTIIINNAASLTTAGYSALGIYASQNGDGAIDISSTANITTSGVYAFGIYGYLDNTVNTANISILANAGTIASTGDDATTIFARHDGLGNIAIDVSATTNTAGERAAAIIALHEGSGNISVNSSGTVSTQANVAHGVIGRHSGQGDIILDASGTITTTGNVSHALHGYASSPTNSGSIAINATMANITVSGHETFAVYGLHDGLGAVSLTSLANIQTSGYEGYGIVGQITNTANQSAINISALGSSIVTLGDGAIGIVGRHDGTGSLEITSNADIETSGSGSNAINAQNRGTGSISVTSSANLATGGEAAAAIYVLNSAQANNSAIVVAASAGSISTSGNNAAGIRVQHVGGGTVSINSGANISTSGLLSHGVYGFSSNASNDQNLVITVDSGLISTTGADSYGIWGRHAGTGDIVTSTGADIYTAAGASIGIHNQHTGAGSIFLNSTANVSTSGDNAHAIHSYLTSGSNEQAIQYAVSNSQIVTYGDYARGISAHHDGAGSIVVNSDSSVSTSGKSAFGIYGLHGGTGITLLNSYSPIVTSGSGASALYGRNNGLGSVSITLASTISTSGDAGVGVHAYISKTTSNAPITISAVGSEINTSGYNSHGILGHHDGNGTIQIVAAGSLRTSGENADGIRITGGGENNFSIIFRQGRIVGGSNEGAAIHVANLGTGTIVIESGTISALSDRAIVTSNANTNIVNNGTITGQINTGSGNDNFVNASSNSLNLRNFQDFSNSGIRETEGVAVNNFGAGYDEFINTNTGVVRLLTVGDQTSITQDSSDDAPATVWIFDTPEYFPVGSARRSITNNGVEQAHLLNLELFVNSGIITMQDAETGGVGPVAGDVLVISASASAGTSGNGEYRSLGGQLRLDTKLDDGVVDTTDVLVVDRATNGGLPTSISIANAGGQGAVTGSGPTDGILVVEVLEKGGSDATAFRLEGRLSIGPIEYELVQADGQNWYLQSDLQAQVYGYSAVQNALRPGFDTLWKRRIRRGHDGVDGITDQPGSRFRLRGSYSATSANATITLGEQSIEVSTDISRASTDFAHEANVLEIGDAVLVAGISLHLRNTDVSVRKAVKGLLSQATIRGYGIGGSVTWHGPGSFYADGVGEVTYQTVDVSGSSQGTNSFKGVTWLSGMEVGYGFDKIIGGLRFVPQAQLTWVQSAIESFRDNRGLDISWGSSAMISGRLGLGVEIQPIALPKGQLVSGHLAGNILGDFLPSSEFIAAGRAIKSQINPLRFDGRVGVNVSTASKKQSIYAEMGLSDGLTGSRRRSIDGSAGLRLNF